MARKARPTSKSRKTSLPEQRTNKVRSNPRTGERPAPSGLDFHEARAPRGAYVADTPSYHYAIKSVASGWELRIYERTNGSGEGQQPGSHEVFASHSKTMKSKSACIALAQAFHNLGDSFNEFAHGYRSRFSQALLDVENPAQKVPAATPHRAPTLPPSSTPKVATTKPNNATNQAGAPMPQTAQPAASKSMSHLVSFLKQVTAAAS